MNEWSVLDLSLFLDHLPLFFGPTSAAFLQVSSASIFGLFFLLEYV
jgi:hypothetical protein